MTRKEKILTLINQMIKEMQAPALIHTLLNQYLNQYSNKLDDDEIEKMLVWIESVVEYIRNDDE